MLVLNFVYGEMFLKIRMTGVDLEEPNCARQGQIFPNSSKRNQKLAKKQHKVWLPG